MRRVAWVLTDLTGGGAERLPLLLAPAMRDTRLEVLLLKDHLEHHVPDGVAVTALGPRAARLGPNAPRLLGGITRRASDAEVIVGGLEWASTLFAVAAAMMLGRPAMAVVHTDVHALYAEHRLPAIAWSAYRLALGRCRAVVGVSPDAMRAIERLGVPAARRHHIPNPVAGAPAAAPRPARDPAAPLRILSVGRLIALKGVDVMLETAAALADLSFEWTILGDGPERASLETRARALGLTGRVRFAGFHPDPAPYFAAADLFVLASRIEGMPLALTEAMRAALPTVATRCGAGVVETLGEGADAAGVLTPVGDAAALAAAIRSLALDPARAARLGATALTRARGFEPAAVASRYEALFAEVSRG